MPSEMGINLVEVRVLRELEVKVPKNEKAVAIHGDDGGQNRSIVWVGKDVCNVKLRKVIGLAGVDGSNATAH